MPDDSPSKPRGSCFGKLVSFLTFAGVAAMGAAVWFMWQPQDLADVKGAGPTPSGKRAPDLMTAMKNSLKGGYAMTINEEDLNLYLKQVLVTRQDGFLSKYVTLDGVCVRLEEERAEVILQRRVFGRPMTTSMYIQFIHNIALDGKIEREIAPHGGLYHKDLPYPLYKGGRFGKVEVPQGFLYLIKPTIDQLGVALKPEFSEGLEGMGRITLQKGKLLLNPTGDDSGPPLLGGHH